MYAHQPKVLPYIIAASAAYGLDHVFRILKTRIFYARMRPIPDLMMTRVEIPALNAGWRPGQHVRLRVLSSAMGWTGWAKAHPFTIASVTKTPEGLVLMCKKAGGWTGKLYEMAKVAGYGREDGRMSRSVLVMLEGPYGECLVHSFMSNDNEDGLRHRWSRTFNFRQLLCGTVCRWREWNYLCTVIYTRHHSGMFSDLLTSSGLMVLQRDLEGASRVKVLELVWCVQDPCMSPLAQFVLVFDHVS